MKKSNLYSLFALFLLIGMMSCQSSSSESEKAEEVTEEKPELTSKDFQASFIGNYTYVGPDTLAIPKCMDSLSAWRAIVDCSGSSNVMGEIEVHFDFCGSEKGSYGNTYAYMVDVDSDTLFINVTGSVIQGRTDEHPEHVVSYWKDNFEILGGSGKYEGASGGGTTDDYNSSEDPNSHHNWKGTISM